MLTIKKRVCCKKGGGGIGEAFASSIELETVKTFTPTPSYFYTDRLPFVIQIFLSLFLLKINDIGFSVSVEPTAIIHTLQEKSWGQMKRKKWKEIEEGRGEMKAAGMGGGGGERHRENNGKN